MGLKRFNMNLRATPAQMKSEMPLPMPQPFCTIWSSKKTIMLAPMS